MRHRNSKIVLNKSRAHTKAVVRNLITSLIKHGRITTTAKKAKILKAQVEKLISRSKKRERVHAIREAGKIFFVNEVAKSFFDSYLPAVKDRTSGFVRTYKIGPRMGDAAEQVMVELIDFPAAKEETPAPKAKAKKKVATPKKKTTKKAAAAA